MKFITFILLLLCFSNKDDDFVKLDSQSTNLFLESKWSLYKTVEIFQRDTTIYDSEANMLSNFNGFLSFKEKIKDSTTYLFQSEKGICIQKDSITLDFIIQEYGMGNKKSYFFGTMHFSSLTDSSAVLQKNISRNNNHVRVFYLKKRELGIKNSLKYLSIYKESYFRSALTRLTYF
ncbi:hypothetical protein WAF17_01580 [Bernardetia sp. ABR2-2B]|uniref:hypothetical protein n=1 Tax=Bernardetia sp. ABR2-2B TaxID=3127472 RepID=UPI0030D1BA86